jgi:manganese oxidase
MHPPVFPSSGPEYQPVVTLNGWTLPWRMNGDWKESYLMTEPVVREFAPGVKAYLWGHNGQSPGPTIEAVEGDKVRIYVLERTDSHTRSKFRAPGRRSLRRPMPGATFPLARRGSTYDTRR